MIKEITETLTILFISSIFLSIFLAIAKIQSQKSDMVRSKLLELGERFEILITNPKCILEDFETKIPIDQKEYICGKGKIETYNKNK